MADDVIDPPDDQAERLDAFFERHAIPAGTFAPMIDQAVNFTAATAAEDGPAGDSAARWSSYGARNIGGRIRALAQHPNYPLVIYAGTAQGGVFKSSDGGDTWAPLGGPAAVFPVGALAVSRSNPNVLYIGSGEPVVTHSINGAGAVVSATPYPAGRGFFRFTEGALLGAAEVGPAANMPAGTAGAADSFARIAVDPRNADRCWMATHTGLWRREAGPSFLREQVPAAVPAPPALGSAATDVLAFDGVDPDHPERVRLYAAFGAQGVYRGLFDPALFNPVAPNAVTVWSPILANGLPAPSSAAGLTWDRIRLGACASQPDHVYALAEAAGLPGAPILGVFHSADAGEHWAPCSLPPPPPPGTNNNAWYSLFIEVHPENPAIVVIGALNVQRSTDFGANWELVLDWLNYDRGDHAQHADQHNALFDAADPRRLWLANDGGISMADDIVQGHPLRDRGWRKRSHGIKAAMFNDITVHPTYPQMLGGGLQDNGTYISFGGETWYSVFGGDGGQMAFEVGDPRVFIAPWQGQLERSTVSSALAAFTRGARAPTNADRDPPNDVFTAIGAGLNNGFIVAPPSLHLPLFVPVVEHHPSAAGRVLVGRKNGGTYISTDFGTSFTFAGHTALQFGAGDVSALAFGIQAGANADFWVGSNRGVVLRGVNNPPAATAWTVVTPPGSASPPGTPALTLNAVITRIAVHPADDRYVACCTATSAAPQQGRVYLTADRGAHWTDITGLGVGGANVARSLPPGPCTSLAFDPQPAAAALQALFVGTLAGVFVIRNLPRRSPAAGAALPAFGPLWNRFSGMLPGSQDGPAPLPLILVEDLQTVTLPARTDAGVVANSVETVRRVRLMAATFGRGLYACDISQAQAAGIGVGGPPHRVYIRQTVVEDGLSYPRQAPVTLNRAVNPTQPAQLGGDPRFPAAGAGYPVRFTDREAFDIRVDNAPFQFFEDVLDGVEFDEGLYTKAVAAGEPNVVSVQVHSCGWSPVISATVHLYFAASPAPVADPNAAPVPDLHADFWAHWLDAPMPAPAVAPAGNAAAWQRAGPPVHLSTVGPNQPEVARVEWLAPATLPAFVALLALVTTPAGVDPLDPAGQPTVMATLLRRERRAAFRVAPVTPFVPDLFIRDGLDDTGRLGGVAFGGRSPDIIVVPAALADLPGTTADLANPRSADRVLPGPADNFVYVRVHNRKAVDTPVDVELFWATSNPAISAAADPAGPITDNTKWQAAAGLGPVANVVVPANAAVLVGFKVSNVPAPQAGLPNSLAFIALIQASAGGDAKPARTRVTDAASFRRFFLQLADANNAALRSVRYA